MELIRNKMYEIEAATLSKYAFLSKKYAGQGAKKSRKATSGPSLCGIGTESCIPSPFAG